MARRRDDEVGGMWRFGRRRAGTAEVWARGARGAGRIVGIEVRDVEGPLGGSRIEDYAVEVAGDPPFVVGVRQRLRPDVLVRLGMKVPVRTLGRRAVIDWGATDGRGGPPAARILDRPPAPGIRDVTSGRAKAAATGDPAVATITAARVRDVALGLSRVLDLDITVRADGRRPYLATLEAADVPFYASHLCEPGMDLPAFVRPGRPEWVVLDWAAAASEEPGVGRPPAEVLAGTGTVLERRRRIDLRHRSAT